ncbi:MAG TPA: GAF domain-containing protein [Tepidisphaeraceae bacterium]|jgi:two-component sensor histidine kinase|nr:GAF domain-containing protein [Tepidisphaeraceae bacterium]
MRITVPVIVFLLLALLGLHFERASWSPPWLMEVLAMVAGICAWQAIEQRHRNRVHTAAIDALNDISAAITDSPEQSQAVLGRVTQLAADMLGMPGCSLNLYNPDEQTMTFAYLSGIPAPVGAVYRLIDVPANEECLRTRKLVFVADAAAASAPYKDSPMHRYGIRSILVIPLLVKGKPIGAISVCDSRARRFSAASMRMAEMWAAQAAIIIRNAELYHRMDQANREQQRMIEQRETLYQVNLAIQEADSLEMSLQRIADLSPGALEMAVCIVGLPTSRPDEFRVASVTRLDPSWPLTVGSLTSCDHAVRAFHTRQPVIITDARNDPSISSYALPVGSAMYLPLVGNDGAIGVLALFRPDPAEYPVERVQLAELFASRAATAIEHARLLEQTRRDADAKAMLLRELNHRVKNNLAGIAGLLSTWPADLPQDARQWLDRIIDRVDGLSRIHELFLSGCVSLTLPELIQKSLDSIFAIRPPGVRIEFDLEGDDVKLFTDRAVTLAMVLHELASNALRHGVGEAGTVLIRSRVNERRMAIVEMMDDGSGFEAISNGENGAATAVVSRPAVRGSGIGLSLVRGLVGRELHGEFTLEARTEGGMTATIQFPADREKGV